MQVAKKARHDNPFTEDDAPEPKEREGSDIERVEPREDDSPQEKVLSVEPPERDDDEPGEPTPRQQKRRERYNEMQQKATDAERRAIEAEHRAAAAMAQLQMPRQEQQKQVDPLDEEERKLELDWQGHLALADALKGAPKEQQDKWRADWFGFQKRMQTIAVKKELRLAGVQQGNVNMDEEVTKAYIRTNFPDVVSNRRALMYADGLVRQKLAREGRESASMKDYEETLNQTRRDLRMPGASSPAPSEDVRRKFSGHGLNGGSNGTNGSQSREVTMNSDMLKMAEAKYTHETDPKTGKKRRLKPAEAHAKWARNEGRKVLEKYK